MDDEDPFSRKSIKDLLELRVKEEVNWATRTKIKFAPQILVQSLPIT
jgi:hypothetical protein